jgi:proline-rich tail region repeat protein
MMREGCVGDFVRTDTSASVAPTCPNPPSKASIVTVPDVAPVWPETSAPE